MRRRRPARSAAARQIVNAYDNALLYTDHVLAALIAKLQARRERASTRALLYVSDHGESLGENDLLPARPAVRDRARRADAGADGDVAVARLRARAAGAGRRLPAARAPAQPAAHDHLFHTVLGLLDVRTALHEPAWDLTAGCRAQRPRGGR
ncbi:MAG: sulfatase-like hydrolase/transferase [Comamonadaceae bacterium]|nr:sulfatase-like hydrolase/transferase [Comamonadaceae bacterium]